MFKRIYLACCFLIFLIVISLAFITFKPVRNVTISDVSPVTGVVQNVTSGNGGDIYIQLQNDTHNYYINNALKHGLSTQKLSADILEKEVTLQHINRWTPFSRDGVFPHISKLSCENKVLFNEIINE